MLHEYIGSQTAVESDSNERQPWYNKYFQKIVKDLKDNKTGVITQTEFRECFLPKFNTDSNPCKAAYIFVPKNGTGN